MNLFDIIFKTPECANIPRIAMARLEPHTRLFVAQSFAYKMGLIKKETFQKCYDEYNSHTIEQEESENKQEQTQQQSYVQNTQNDEEQNPYLSALEKIFGNNLPENTAFYDTDGIPLYQKNKPVFGNYHFDQNGELIKNIDIQNIPNTNSNFNCNNPYPPNPTDNFYYGANRYYGPNYPNFANPYFNQYWKFKDYYQNNPSNFDDRISNALLSNIVGYVDCNESNKSKTFIDTNITSSDNNNKEKTNDSFTSSDDNKEEITAIYNDGDEINIKIPEDILNKIMKFYIKSLIKRDGVEKTLTKLVSFFIENESLMTKTNVSTITKFDFSKLVDFEGDQAFIDESRKAQLSGFQQIRDAFNSYEIEEPFIKIDSDKYIRETKDIDSIKIPNMIGDNSITIKDSVNKWNPNKDSSGNYIYDRNGYNISNNISGNYTNQNPWNNSLPYYPSSSYAWKMNTNNFPNIDFQKIADSMTDEELIKLKVQQETNLRNKEMGISINQEPPKSEKEMLFRTLPGTINFRKTKFDPTPEENAEILGISNNNYQQNNPVVNNIPPSYNQQPYIPPQFMNQSQFDINNIGGNVFYYNGIPYTSDRIQNGDPNNPLYGIVTPEHPEGDTNIQSTIGVIPPQAFKENWLDYNIQNPNINKQPKSNFFQNNYPYASYNMYNPTAIRCYEDSFMVPTEFDIKNNIFPKSQLLLENSQEYIKWKNDKERMSKSYIGKSFYEQMKDVKNNPSSRTGIEFIDPDTGEKVIKIIKDFYNNKDEGKYVINQKDYTEEEYQKYKENLLNKKESHIVNTKTQLKPEDYKKNSPKWVNFMNERKKQRELESMNSDDKIDHFMHYNDELTEEDIQQFKHLRIKKILEERRKLEELYVNPTFGHLKRLQKFCNEYGKYDLARAMILYDMLNSEDTLREDFYIFFEYCIKHLRLLKIRENSRTSVNYKVPYRYRKLPTYTIDENGKRVWDDSFLNEYHEYRELDINNNEIHKYDSNIEDGTKEAKERLKVFLLKALDEKNYIIEREKKNREKDIKERKLYNGRTEEEIIAAYNPYDPNSVYMYNKVKHQKEIDKQYNLYRRIFGGTMTDEQFDNWFYGPKQDEFKEPTLEEQIAQRRKYLNNMTDNSIKFLSTISPLDYDAITNEKIRRFNESFYKFDEGLLTNATSLKDIIRALPILERKLADERIEKQRIKALNESKVVSYDRFHNELVRWFNETETGYDLKTSQSIFGIGSPVDPSTGMPSNYIDISKNNPNYEDKLARFLHHCETSRGTIPMSPLYK